IIHGAAQQLALLAAAVRSQLWQEGETMQVAYIGGMFESAILRARFQALVELHEGVTCGPPLRGPAEGALLEAVRSGT
ncbi:MAG TPA: ATPase, partial [Verrucomicrobiae bacterium]|nr:ATPase [Verrucomicrobiae bacterium]